MVDFPLPVGPVIKISPLSISANWFKIGGIPSSSADLIIDDYHFTEDLFPIEGNRWNVNDSLPIIIPPVSYDTLIVQFIQRVGEQSEDVPVIMKNVSVL